MSESTTPRPEDDKHRLPSWEVREAKLREAPKYSATCPQCGETRLMWRHDFDSGMERLWQPFHFHECKNG